MNHHTNETPTFDAFLAKVESLKENASVDLSTTEDLSIAVMNLISLEEHFFFTGVKTHKDEYFDTAEEVRSLRKELLAKLIDAHEGETWCISKHLLATTMRLIEVGNKLQTDNKKEEAKKMYEDAYKVYSIFWALKLHLIEGKSFQNAVPVGETGRLQDLVSKLADCCKE